MGILNDGGKGQNSWESTVLAANVKQRSEVKLQTPKATLVIQFFQSGCL